MFADFVVNHLDPHEKKSFIQITDCFNFFVIGGITESKDVLDISQIKSSFYQKYSDIFKDLDIDKFNFIDLVEYDKIVVSPNNITFGPFYNTDRPIYNHLQSTINFSDSSYVDYSDGLLFGTNFGESSVSNRNMSFDGLHISSELPHGFSLKFLRDKLYYSEYISYNIFSIIGISKVKLNWIEGIPNLESDSFIDPNKIDSVMKDVFDFDMKLIHEKVKNYNFIDDILQPLSEKPWLVKDKVSELYII